MKHRILALSLIAATAYFFPPAAFADAQCNGNQNCNTTTNNEGGTGVGVGVGIGKGGDASATGGTAVNAPITVNDNTNIAKGGEGGDAGVAFSGNSANKIDVNNETANLNVIHNKSVNWSSNKQKQGQAQFQNSESEVKNSGNSNVAINNPRETAQAWAAPAAIGTDSCSTGVGAGGQGPAFGFSLNFARDDDMCEMLKLSRRLQDLGYGDAAVRILCQDDRVAIALPLCTAEAVKE